MRHDGGRSWVMALLLGIAIGAQAQTTAPAQPVTIRGTVVTLEGARLRVATASGEQDVTLVEPLSIIGARRAELADITPGSFVGTAARTDADGVDPGPGGPYLPGIDAGHRGGASAVGASGTTMTNATVEAVVQRAEGPVLTLKYRDGEVRVVVTPDTPIVRFEPGERGLIVPGAHVVLSRATRAGDGTIHASRVTVGVDGARLPM